jgi:hypothetical protein
MGLPYKKSFIQCGGFSGLAIHGNIFRGNNCEGSPDVACRLLPYR